MNKVITFFFTLGLLTPNALLPEGTIYVTVPQQNTKTNPYANMSPQEIMKALEKNLPKNVNVQGVQTAKIEYIESNDTVANFRTKIINEEISKVKVPTETTDELLFLKNQKEKEKGAKNTSGNFMGFVDNATMIPVRNNSNLAIECGLTALHTTSEKTALFSRKYNKYVAQTMVSATEIIKPQTSAVLALDTTGVNISNTETIIAITVAAVQMTSKKHVLQREHFTDQTILVHDIITESWMSTNKIDLKNPAIVEFPNNFVLGLTQTQSHQGPNYYNLIAYMRACERIYEASSEQVEFPAAYFNPDYIGRLDEKELNNLYQFIMKKFYQKSIAMPVGLTGLINCGKVNFIAQAIGKIVVAVVLILTGGFGIAALSTDAASVLQTAVENFIAIGQGVEALKTKGRL